MSRYRTVGSFLLLAAVWGTAFMAIKAGLQYFPPVLYAALRYDVAGVLMLGYAALVTDDWLPRGRQWLVVAPGAVLMIAAYHAFLFVGEQGTTSAAAAVVVSLAPVLTAGFARLLLPDERIEPLGIIGLGLGLVGVAVLASPDPTRLLAGSLWPEAFVLTAATAFALGSVLTRAVEVDLSIESMEAWSMVLGAVLMHLVSFALPEESMAAIAWTPEAVGALLYLSVVASALGFLLYFDLLDRLGPTEINLVGYVVPVFAAVSGWLWLGEVIDDTTVLGFLVIVAGFVLVKRRALGEELNWIRDRVGGSASDEQ